MLSDQCPYANVFLNGWSKEAAFVSARDRDILRDLAAKLREAAMRPNETEKLALWNSLNRLDLVRPLVYMDPEGGWHEILDCEKDLVCEGYMARGWETWLRKELFYAYELRDDKPIEARFYLPYRAADSGWGITEERIGDFEHGQAVTWKPPLAELDFDEINLEDYIKMPVITVDREATEAYTAAAHEVFDGLLEIEMRHRWWWSNKQTRYYADLRGLENYLYDLYDYPEQVHKLMRLFTDGFLLKLDYLERNGLLTSNSGNMATPSGGIGYTDQLHPAAGHVRAMDMWGFVEAQETSEISPEMFKEFVLPYHVEIAERFGLNAYGCCEPLDGRFELIRSAIPRLRRVSVSPWASMEKMSDMLGRDYIYCFKPSPTDLAVPEINEDAARGRVRRMLEYTKRNENRIEIMMKDNHTLGRNRHNAVRWVEIVREEIARVY